MTFINTISISDIISLAAILISLVTLVFLFIQRKDNSKTKVVIHDNNSSIVTNDNNYDTSSIDLSLNVLGQEYIQDISVDLFLYSSETDKVIDFYQNDKRGWRLENRKAIKSEIITKSAPLNISKAVGNYFGIMCEMWREEIIKSFKNKSMSILRPTYCLYLICSYKDINGYKYKTFYRIEARLSMFNGSNGGTNKTECFFKIRPISKKDINKVLKADLRNEDFWYTTEHKEEQEGIK